MDKKEINKKIAQVSANFKQLEKRAGKELQKIKKDLEKTKVRVEDYVKKNPEQAALISAGLGAALGAVLTLLLKRKRK